MIETFSPDTNPFIVGIVADTHIPDRVDGLHPYLIDALRGQKVQLLFHAGDISVLSVLNTLAEVAPVLAVTGNRDFLLRKQIPLTRHLVIFGSQIALTHGHLGMRTYWRDKVAYLLHGYKFERYQDRLNRSFKQARVIIFGHTHHAENRWIDDRLYFNPGSVSKGDYLQPGPTFGLLKFFENGRIEASLIPLTGAVIRMKKWEIISHQIHNQM